MPLGAKEIIKSRIRESLEGDKASKHPFRCLRFSLVSDLLVPRENQAASSCTENRHRTTQALRGQQRSPECAILGPEAGDTEGKERQPSPSSCPPELPPSPGNP